MKITKFDITLCRENVLMLIDCYEDSEIYSEVIKEYDELAREIYEKIEPVALLAFDEEALYCITSIGEKVSNYATQFFEEGDYLKGMLVDAMADDYLFQMDHQLKEPIISMCKERGYGVTRRLEAPNDVSMEVQKKALEVTKGESLAGIHILKSYMYSPVKTTCQIYKVERGTDMFRIEHDCSSCPNLTCKVRNTDTLSVTIKSGGEQIVAKGKIGQELLELLKKEGIYLSALCAGRGTCGKCKIQVQEGEIPVSIEDKSFFSEAQLEAGYRLACQAQLKEDCVILVDTHGEDEFEIVTSYDAKAAGASQAKGGYAIAADIGTTTIAMQLIELETGMPVSVYTTINKQRAFGADVISRIEASNSGSKEALKDAILEDLKQGVNALTKAGKIEIKKMIIGANTTMVHLLMGYSCETLGVFPFTPVNIDTIHTTSRAALGKEVPDFELMIFPGISTYVGGDITAGLYGLDFDKKDEISVLIDLGTNGEMAIGNKDRILVAAAAAGPAFEGGNISCGTGSVPGAICKVLIKEGKAVVDTILDKPATGICGTGVIDTTYELLKEELLDETGLLEDAYFDEGFLLAKDERGRNISFTQKDIRELQLAKSAIRAGIEMLILRYEIEYKQIDKIYIAGGFGYKIDINKAIGIGLLPEECKGKIEAVGNSCLKGASLLLNDKHGRERLQHIMERAKEVHLSNDKTFNELYMEHMYFSDYSQQL